MIQGRYPWLVRWMFVKRRSPGQMIILLAFSFVVFLLFVGTAVDYGSILKEEQQIQNAIDAASLAGARAMLYAPTPGPTAAVAAANSYLQQYGYVSGSNSVVTYKFTTPVGTPGTPRPLDSMQITVDRDKPTLFWRLAGINNTHLARTATAKPGESNLFDVVLSLDETGSMSCISSSLPSPGDGQCNSASDIADLKRGVKVLLDQLKPSTTNPRSAKVALAVFEGLTCPTTTDGVIGWGENGSGQLGDSSVADRTSPVVAGGMTDPAAIAAISAGGGHSLALLDSGANNRVRTWGLNGDGQLGDTTTANKSSAQTPSIPGAASLIAAGGKHSMVATNSGGARVYTFGDNSRGQLGTTGGDRSNPFRVIDADVDGVAFSELAAGGLHSMALRSNTPTNFSRIVMWGDDTYGQLGDGAPNDGSFVTAPFRLPAVLPTGEAGTSLTVDLISAGGSHSLAAGTVRIGVNVVPRVWAWGRNQFGQIGQGNNTTPFYNTPHLVPGIPATSGVTVSRLAAGDNYNLVLLSDGRVYVWGDNSSGQLGFDPAGTPQLATATQLTFPVGLGRDRRRRHP